MTEFDGSSGAYLMVFIRESHIDRWTDGERAGTVQEGEASSLAVACIPSLTCAAALFYLVLSFQ